MFAINYCQLTNYLGSSAILVMIERKVTVAKQHAGNRTIRTPKLDKNHIDDQKLLCLQVAPCCLRAATVKWLALQRFSYLKHQEIRYSETVFKLWILLQLFNTWTWLNQCFKCKACLKQRRNIAA